MIPAGELDIKLVMLGMVYAVIGLIAATESIPERIFADMTGNVVNFHKPNGENIQKREVLSQIIVGSDIDFSIIEE